MKPDSMGMDVLAGVIQQQALVNAFISTFWLTTASFVAMLPLLLLIEGAKPRAADPAHMAME
jgi:hypothetical protein